MERGKERFPYDVNDLIKIFGSKVRSEIKKPCLYWMPLLALYTGARAEELAAIEINDITEYEPDLWQMRFKKGKTIASIRTIPIHPEIINAGFLDYVDDVKRKWPNAVTLFPYMKPVKGRLTHRFSQDYGLFRNNLGLLTGKDFHSFRTTLIGCLIKNKAHHEIKRAYVGHENEGKRDEHDKSYGDKTPFSASEIATDIFPKIDYQYSHKFVMPSQSPYNKGRFNRYFDSALKRG